MQTYTDITYYLDPRDDLQVIALKAGVTVTLNSHLTLGGRGFSVKFLPAHLEALREAVAHLETLTVQTEHIDHDPFEHDDACPACQHEAALEDARQDAEAERCADAAPIAVAHDVF